MVAKLRLQAPGEKVDFWKLELMLKALIENNETFSEAFASTVTTVLVTVKF